MNNDDGDRVPTAAVLIIGDEILSGRTRDSNLQTIALKLEERGIRLREVRVVPDLEAEIAAAVNALRRRYTYVFTTGGIGPTHDDITAAAIAVAVGKPLTRHPEAWQRMSAHYARIGVPFNEVRARMAHTPEGATLIDNPVSIAPGFIIDNVLVLAGVPEIMKAMLESALPHLVGGAPMLSRTVLCGLPEGTIAAGLAAVENAHPGVKIGSYPSWTRRDGFEVALVLRSIDAAALEQAATTLRTLIRDLGGTERLVGDT